MESGLRFALDIFGQCSLHDLGNTRFDQSLDQVQPGRDMCGHCLPLGCQLHAFGFNLLPYRRMLFTMQRFDDVTLAGLGV